MAISTEFKPRTAVKPIEKGFELEGQAFTGFSTLALDGARARPRYFDGRFLTGKDLSRDQDYVRQRQDDLARASGTGIGAGLFVTQVNAETLSISAGFGVTPSGELVVMSSARDVPLTDVAETEKLDASFGIRAQPATPFHKRTGLFIIALRPVEYTANQITAYPTTITGQRRTEDGDIIEATAVTLIPFPVSGDPFALRAAAARQIFLDSATRGLPAEALPLAMIELRQGAIQWVDVNMVRRENRGTSSLQRALGVRPAAVAEAHLLQYQEHLESLGANRLSAFTASSVFSVLPPVGQMPLACLTHDGFGFKESFFPPSLQVDVSFIPSDEIGALVRESLSLAPIDLSADPAELAGTGIAILIPLPRADVNFALRSFGNTNAQELKTVIRPRLRIEDLKALNAIMPVQMPRPPAAEAGNWQDIRGLAQKTGNGLIWFARRRSVAYRSSLEGVAQSAPEAIRILESLKKPETLMGDTGAVKTGPAIAIAPAIKPKPKEPETPDPKPQPKPVEPEPEIKRPDPVPENKLPDPPPAPPPVMTVPVPPKVIPQPIDRPPRPPRDFPQPMGPVALDGVKPRDFENLRPRTIDATVIQPPPGFGVNASELIVDPAIAALKKNIVKPIN